MLSKISLISDNVNTEKEEMEKINSTIEELHNFANDIAEMVAKQYK